PADRGASRRHRRGAVRRPGAARLLVAGLTRGHRRRSDGRRPADWPGGRRGGGSRAASVSRPQQHWWRAAAGGARSPPRARRRADAHAPFDRDARRQYLSARATNGSGNAERCAEDAILAIRAMAIRRTKPSNGQPGSAPAYYDPETEQDALV